VWACLGARGDILDLIPSREKTGLLPGEEGSRRPPQQKSGGGWLWKEKAKNPLPVEVPSPWAKWCKVMQVQEESY